MDLFSRLEAARSRWNVLEHPFYQRWSAGELTREELSHYASQYRHAVVALADAVEATSLAAEPAERPELREHAAEERAHVDLWDDFAMAVGAPVTDDPAPETAECVRAWTEAGDALEGLVVLYAIESGQPAIAETKLRGLLGEYGFEEGPATEYFALHAERDHEHAAHSRALIEQRLEGEDGERLVLAAERALRGNWTLLDGVDSRFGH